MADAIATEKGITLVGVIAEGDLLARKIELLLGGGYTVIRASEDDKIRYDALVKADYSGGNIYSVLIRRNESEISLPYPFSFGEFREAIGRLMSGEAAVRHRLIIEPDGRHAVLDGERIRLTESEHKLLSLIAAGDGELVGREELTRGAFGDEAEGGILNVYIHYLREKLESGGEKIILSSRRGGYRIDKKYLGGDR